MAKRKGDAAPAAFGNIITTVLDPRLFRKLEQLCNTAIRLTGNHPEVRSVIASMNVEMRMDANKAHGHDTIDCWSLSQLLARTNPDKPPVHVPPPPDRDPIDVLELAGRLTPAQVSAAALIRDVWKAFGRCLSISGRGYERGGGAMRRASALQPLDVMGQEIWETYKDLYVPWYERVKVRTVNCKTTGNVRVFAVLFDIIIKEYTPVQVDHYLKLEAGTAEKVLCRELDGFWDDHAGGPRPRMVSDTGALSAAA